MVAIKMPKPLLVGYTSTGNTIFGNSINGNTKFYFAETSWNPSCCRIDLFPSFLKVLIIKRGPMLARYWADKYVFIFNIGPASAQYWPSFAENHPFIGQISGHHWADI